jgi:hypothetical protein
MGYRDSADVEIAISRSRVASACASFVSIERDLRASRVRGRADFDSFVDARAALSSGARFRVRRFFHALLLRLAAATASTRDQARRRIFQRRARSLEMTKF